MSEPRCLYLAPDLTIIDATDSYLEMTLTTREDIVGRSVFETFPETPGTRENVGAQMLRTSLQRALAGHRDEMAPFRYDIQRPDGAWEVRYWKVVNTPEFGEDGEVVRIVNQVDDVTLDAITIRQERRKLHHVYLFQNAFVALVAFLLAFSGLTFLLSPTEIAGSMPHVPPYDYIWNTLYLVGGIAVIAGLLDRRPGLEAVGHLLYIPGLVLNLYIAAVVFGELHRIVILTTVFAVAAAFRAHGLIAGWSDNGSR